MLFHAFLLLAHGEKAFAPAARPMMPHAVADATSPATPATVPRLPMQHVAQQIQPTSDSRSSTILMASNVLFYSGLSAQPLQSTGILEELKVGPGEMMMVLSHTFRDQTRVHDTFSRTATVYMPCSLLDYQENWVQTCNVM